MNRKHRLGDLTVTFAYPARTTGEETFGYAVARRRSHGTTYHYFTCWVVTDLQGNVKRWEIIHGPLSERLAIGYAFEHLANCLLN